MKMRLIVDGLQRDVPEASTLADALARFSQYGDEPTVVRVNGVPRRSIDAPEEVTLHDGDVLDIYPLIIGG